MPKHSPARAGWPVLPVLGQPSRGKVRDGYGLANGKRLFVATDGISARDYVLNALIPMNGTILNAMTVFWLKMLEQYGVKHHMVAYGSAIDGYLPLEFRSNTDLQSRAMVVEDLRMDDAEFVVRGCLTGSAVKPYLATGEVCGHKLPLGLQDGDELPYVALTPTTKAAEGHDEDVPAEEIIRRYPLASCSAIKVFQIARHYAMSRGIVIPDTKFEYSGDILADEVLTPDSSRFWSANEWRKGRKLTANRKAPSSFDKDPIRRWLDGEIDKWQSAHGGKKMTPKNPEHVDAVHSFAMPLDLIRQSTQRNRYIFWLLTGMTIEQYLRDTMKVGIPERPEKNVLVICGSDSDLPQVKPACDSCFIPGITIHIVSCHRNPFEVMRLGEWQTMLEYDAVICIGGKAFALPGVLDAWAHYYGRNVPIAGVALGEPGSNALLAAQLSIEEIPDQPVIINEMTGHAYTGLSGLRELFDRIRNGELPPPKPRKEKPAQFNV